MTSISNLIFRRVNLFDNLLMKLFLKRWIPILRKDLGKNNLLKEYFEDNVFLDTNEKLDKKFKTYQHENFEKMVKKK